MTMKSAPASAALVLATASSSSRRLLASPLTVSRPIVTQERDGWTAAIRTSLPSRLAGKLSLKRESGMKRASGSAQASAGRSVRMRAQRRRRTSAFLLGVAREQPLHRRRGLELPLEHRVHRLGDGHVDVLLLRERGDFLRRRHALGDMAETFQDLVQGFSARELDADPAVAREIAGAGEDEVTPAGEAHQRP